MKTFFAILAALVPYMPGRAESPQPVECFPVGSVRLTEGPFRHAQDLDIDYLLQLDPDRLLAPYLKEAGLPPKAENYTNWENTGLDGHIGGHYLSALSYMYAATGDERIGQRLDYMLAELRRCQDAAGDGYLCGVPGGRAIWEEIARGDIRAGGFDLNGRWVPLYNIHKIYAGLRDAWLQAGRADARDMLVALTDWMAALVSGLSDSQVQTMLQSEHGGLNEIFADVAAITGDDRYLGLARRFSHRALLDPLLRGENCLTGMHANTQIPKVIGFKRIADLSGDAAWDAASARFWDDVVNHRSVSIGGNSVREHFHAPDDFSSMLESEQGPETCNTYNMLRLSRMLYESTVSPSYMDYAERAIFNHILSSQNPDNGGFVYFTPMRSGHYRVYSQPQTSFWCCVGSGLENHARYGEYIYAHRGDDVYVNLYIPSVLEWGDGNRIEQITEFPREETVRIAVSAGKPSDFALNLRVPAWTDGAPRVSVNGVTADAVARDGYISLSREWGKADTVTVTLPMSLRAERIPDGSANVSFLCGPVVLASSLGTEGQTGLFADDSRGGHVASGPRLPLAEMPVLVAEEDEVLSRLTPVPGEPLAFTLSGVYPSRYEGMKLVPFASLSECRYMIYWPVISDEELATRQEEVARRQAAAEALAAVTVDAVVCGEQQPESDHAVHMDRSEAGADNDRHWRRAHEGGEFGYTLRASGERKAKVLRIVYRGKPDRSATVWLDGVRVGELRPSAEDDGLTHVDIPVKISSPAVLRIKASGSNSTPDVYEVMILE